MFLFYTLMCWNYQNWAKETLLESNRDLPEICLKTFFGDCHVRAEDDVKQKKSSRESYGEFSANRSRLTIRLILSSDAPDIAALPKP